MANMGSGAGYNYHPYYVQQSPAYGTYDASRTATTATSSYANMPVSNSGQNDSYPSLQQYRYGQTSQPQQGTARSEWSSVNHTTPAGHDQNSAHNLDRERHQSGLVNYETSAPSVSGYDYGGSSVSATRSTTNHAVNQNYTAYSNNQAEQAPQPSYASAKQSNDGHSNTSYNQQQARPDSANSAHSTHSHSYSPEVSQAAAASRYQHQRTGATQRRVQSPLMQQQAVNHQQQRVVQGACASQPFTSRGTTSNSRGNNNTNRINEYDKSRSPRQNLARPPMDQAQATYPDRSTSPPAAATVDPSQVYNPYHEYERQMERPRQEEAAKKAAEQAKQEQERAEAAKAESAAKETTTKSSKQGRSKGKKSASKVDADKKLSNSSQSLATDEDGAAAAAHALMKSANSTSTPDLEAEMRAMFLRMREFNAKNPELLAKLWNQEREEFQAVEEAKKAPELAKSTPANAPVALKQQTDSKSASSRTKKADQGPSKSAPSRRKKSSVDPPLPPPVSASPPAARQTASAPGATAAPGASPPTPMSAQLQIQPAQNAVTVQTTPVAEQSDQQQTSAPRSTIWPAAKKAQLSAAAAKFLNAIPANYGKSIQPAQISVILDREPDYVQLCQAVESLGVWFDRSRFAKALLIAVPDINGKPAQNAQSTEASAPKKEPSEDLKAPPIAGVTFNGNVTLNDTLAEAEARLLDGENLLSAPVKSKSARRKDGSPGHAKRNEGPTSPFNNTNGQQTQLPHQNILVDPQLEGLDAVKQFVESPWKKNGSTLQPQQNGSRPSLSGIKQRDSASVGPATKHDLARKRTFADLVDLTKLVDDDDNDEQQYPPFKRLETEAHQSSFRPQSGYGNKPVTNSLGQPQGPLNSATSGPSSLSGDTSLPLIPYDHPARDAIIVKEIDRYKAIRRSKYNPITIARDVLLACGRHPDMRHLNAHLETLRAAFSSVDTTSDLGTFRWDLVDPGGPEPGSGAERPIIEPNIEVFNDADDESDEPRPTPTMRQAVGVGVGAGAVAGATLGAISPPALPVKTKAARKWRPQMRASDPTIRTHAGSHDSPGWPSKGGRPRMSEGAAQFSSRADGGQEKKKGRPVGWRKWMQKTPGAPGTAKPSKPLAKSEPEPQYQVYQCQWKNCGTELHNLRTLRKHIHKLHGKQTEDGYFECKWIACGRVVAATDEATQRTTSKFVCNRYVKGTDWQTHVEKKHLTPIAWQLGDGPADGSSDQRDSELSEAYMSDSHGRRVTPRINMPEEQTGPTESLSKAEQMARTLQREAEQRKRQIGPGLDRGGARLVNEKRRQGFIDDDDTMEIIDEDDD